MAPTYAGAEEDGMARSPPRKVTRGGLQTGTILRTRARARARVFYSATYYKTWRLS